MKINLLFLSALITTAQAQDPQPTDLPTTLKNRADATAKRLPQTTLDAQQRAYNELIATDIYNRALKVGDKAPNFTLNNNLGQPVTLEDKLKNGPVVLTWYRGGWCPYCNITLRALAQENPKFTALNTQIIALTPDLPEYTTQSISEQITPFPILTDLNLEIAKKYGINFQLNTATADRYQAKFNLRERNGNAAELPLPATYLIAPDSTILWAFVDADYKRRANPADILQFLQSQKDNTLTPLVQVRQFWANTWNPPYHLALIDRLMTPDFIITNTGKEIKGRDQFKAWVAQAHKNIQDLRLEEQQTFLSLDGTRVTSLWTCTGIDAKTNDPIHFTGTAVWATKNGKLSHNWVQRSGKDPAK